MGAGTIVVADDHPLYRQALTLAAARVRPAAKLVEAGTLGAALAAAGAASDLLLVLLDLKMPGRREGRQADANAAARPARRARRTPQRANRVRPRHR